ncbi:MAG TPA: DUF4142 domain-containing protein [Gammaproteobacteria bacterium]|nr:DUF4142 domain-containing protein [Gammaproteobacteria bacterium]
MNRKWTSMIAAMALAMLCASAYAANSNNLSPQDTAWIKTAHQINLEEIKAGTLAQSKGRAKVVDTAGRMLASDHQRLDSKLRQTAHELGVALPSEASPKEQHTLHQLASMSGSEFDKMWTAKEREGHKKAIRKTQREIAQGSSQQVKQLARATLPVLKKHYNELQKSGALVQKELSR